MAAVHHLYITSGMHTGDFHTTALLTTTTMQSRDGRAWRLTSLSYGPSSRRVEVYAVDADGMETFKGYYDEIALRVANPAVRAFVEVAQPIVVALTRHNLECGTFRTREVALGCGRLRALL